MTSGSAYPMRTLASVGVTIHDCEHKTPKFRDDGFPYVAIPQIRDGRLDLANVSLIGGEDLAAWTRRTVPTAGDIIMTRRGRVGDTGVVPNGLQCAIGQNLVILRSNGSVVDQGYLRWALRGPLYEQQVAKWLNVGAVFESLNVREIPLFEIPVPPLHEQRAIAHVLGTLDDKIELNRQMNQTLDEIARTLFRSWFVDFDPVHAKMNGHQPYCMDAETAALFPDRLVDSDLGPIPDGWEIRPIGDLVQVVGGSTPSTKEPAFWEGGHHLWVTPKDLSGMASPILIDASRRITDAGVNQISSRLLPVGSVLLSSRAPVGYLAITTEPTAINQGFIGMICDRGVPNSYVLNWARENMDTIKGNAGGTTFAEISKTAFRPIPAIRPPADVLKVYTDAVALFYQMIESNLRESRTLGELRDTLLPELLSGRPTRCNAFPSIIRLGE